MARSNAEIAADLRIASTWHGGEQSNFLTDLAAELDGGEKSTPTPNRVREQDAVKAEQANPGSTPIGA